MSKKNLILFGGLLIVICFYLPWVKACGIDISGFQMATDKSIDEPLIWVVFLAGCAIVAAYFLPKAISGALTLYSSIAGSVVLIWRLIAPLAQGKGRGLGLEVHIGGFGTILGLILAIVGAIGKEVEKGEEEGSPKQDTDAPLHKITLPSEAPPNLGNQRSLIDSVKAKALVDQAILLEAEANDSAVEKAHWLWEEALRIGSLQPRDELLCNYYLGSYYLSRQKTPEGVMCLEAVLSRDPALSFLPGQNERLVSLARSELFLRLSAGYQYFARTEIKEKDGIAPAIAYLIEKINLLGNKAAPSIYAELAAYYGLAGDESEAGRFLKEAIKAPSYGSEFQERARQSALDLLMAGPRGESGPQVSMEPSLSKEQAVPFGQLETTGHRRGRSIFLWVCLGCAAIGIGVFFAWPREFNKDFKMARALFQQGNYAESLELVNQAKEHKTTPELLAFEDSLLKKIREIKAQEEAGRLRREYQDYYRSAVESLANGRYDDAKRFSRLAASRMNTRELMSFNSQIEAKMREARLREEIERDDAAFASAVYGNSRTSFNSYLQMYPAGKHSAEARAKLSDLRRFELENQEAQRRQIQALEVQRRQNLANERRRAEEERRVQLAADLQNRVDEKVAALREGCIVQVPRNFTQSSKYRGKIGIFVKLLTMGDKYVLTIKEMKGQKYAWEKADPTDSLDQIIQAVRKRKQFDVTFSKQDLINTEILALDEKSFKDSR